MSLKKYIVCCARDKLKEKSSEYCENCINDVIAYFFKPEACRDTAEPLTQQAF